ncbi:MAG: ParB/RepB/Spo0J family partition protein [Gemmatimonadota bacterium]|nr:ParB/RepB/Spo0J family partition protein [Gemmatimonadota bacterium]
MARRKALGRGLGALIPGADESTTEQDAGSAATGDSHPGSGVLDIAVGDLRPNTHQPREAFDPEAVRELADSIREKGVIQPVVVRRDGTGYQLIAGERRLRAAIEAGLETVPAILLDVGSDQEMMEISLIENVQREDLNPIEEARAYRGLMETCFLTQEEVAQKVGKNRSTVTNTLRLLHLAEEVRNALQEKKISMGHARALLGLEDDRLQANFCSRIISDGLSVRQVENLVRAGREGRREPTVRQPRGKDPQVLSLEEDLQRRFGTGVNINRRGKKGKIEIEFYTDDDLERILDLLRETSY